MYLWDAPSNVLLERLIGRTATVSSVAFAPDGQSLICGTSNGNIKLWDLSPFLRNPNRDKPLGLHVDTALGLIEGSGEKGSRCTDDITYQGVRERIYRSIKYIFNLIRLQQEILYVGMSRDSRYIISSSSTGHVRFWDRRSAKTEVMPHVAPGAIGEHPD